MGNEELKPAETGKQEGNSMIDRAENVARRIEEANKKTEQLLMTQENIATRIALSGRSEAGIKAPEALPLSNKEYAHKVLKGELNVQKK